MGKYNLNVGNKKRYEFNLNFLTEWRIGCDGDSKHNTQKKETKSKDSHLKSLPL